MPRESLTELLEYFRRYAGDAAVARGAGYRMERWSYAEVLAAAHQFGGELQSRGIAKGDRVLLWGENSAEWVAAFWGCLLCGAVVVPMDRIAAPDFVRRVAAEVQPRLAIGSAARLREVPEVARIQFGDTIFAANRVAADATAGTIPIGRNDPLQIIFTSGTTAEPQGVVITHGNVLANLEPIEREIAKYLKFERLFHPLRFLNMLPLSHVFGQFMGLFVPPMIGATVIFQDSLSPAEIIHTIQRERVSALVAVPRLLESLRGKLERDFDSRGKLEWLRREMERMAEKSFLRRWWHFRKIHSLFGQKFWAFVSGGAALPADTEEFWRRLGYAVIQGYGLTETTSLISLAHPFHLSRGAIGKVLPGREMKLDPATGEILVRGESVASGYWQGREVKAVPGEEGWFRTGDIGAVDAEGNLFFKGRKKDVIVTPEGFNVYPEDLEAALRHQPEVRDCVVIGLQREGNAVPCAVLILHSGADAAAVVKRANASLAEHQQMRQWFAWPEHDFPRTSTHKPRTNLIAQAASIALGARASGPAGVAPGSLVELIAQITRRSPVQISPTATLAADLNLSSLERVELLAAIEDRYQVSLDESKFTAATTMADLERMLDVRDETAAVGLPPAPAAQAAQVKTAQAKARATLHYPRWAQRLPMQWLRVLVYYLLSWPATILLALPRIEGRENLRGVCGPVLLVSNHVTYLDAGLILYALPPRLRHRVAVAMAGEMLNETRYPPRELNWFLKLVSKSVYWLMTALFNVFPLPQRAGFRESFAFTGESVDRGYSVLVFPEGARTPDGRLAAFRSGIGLLAKNLRLPVVPVRIDGLWDIKKTGRRGSAPWRAITLRVGKPVMLSGDAEAEHIAKQLEEAVRNL